MRRHRFPGLVFTVPRTCPSANPIRRIKLRVVVTTFRQNWRRASTGVATRPYCEIGSMIVIWEHTCAADLRLNNKPSTIREIKAIQLLDSRARPTVGVEVTLQCGISARASSPSGASTGGAEALELRDGDSACFRGDGVLRAVDNVRKLIAPAIIGVSSTEQASVDAAMKEVDGSGNWGRLGANAVLATSIAVCRAAAQCEGVALHRYIAQLSGSSKCSIPMPMTNILSGGLHARNAMDLQDFLVVPIGADSYAEALHWIYRVRESANDVAQRNGISTLLADEGGLSPACDSVRGGFELMSRIFEDAKLRPGEQVAIAVDMAANGLLQRDGRYLLARENRALDAAGIAELLTECRRLYPLVSIEDPCAEEDWGGWATVTRALGSTQVVGDDLFATQSERIEHGVRLGAANATLIKINQNGSLSGTLEVLATARKFHYRTIVSARSGETEDDIIADLAVGTNAGQIKIGSVRCSERMSKYNRLAWIVAEERDTLPLANPWRDAEVKRQGLGALKDRV
jgi:enolase